MNQQNYNIIELQKLHNCRITQIKMTILLELIAKNTKTEELYKELALSQ